MFAPCINENVSLIIKLINCSKSLEYYTAATVVYLNYCHSMIICHKNFGKIKTMSTRDVIVLTPHKNLAAVDSTNLSNVYKSAAENSPQRKHFYFCLSNAW